MLFTIFVCWIGFNLAVLWLLILPSLLDWMEGGDRIYAHARPHPYLADERQRAAVRHTRNTESEKVYHTNNVIRFELTSELRQRK